MDRVERGTQINVQCRACSGLDSPTRTGWVTHAPVQPDNQTTTVDTCMIFSAAIACSWEFLVCHGYLLLGDATDMLLRAVASCVGGTNLLGDATDMRRFTSSMELAV